MESEPIRIVLLDIEGRIRNVSQSPHRLTLVELVGRVALRLHRLHAVVVSSRLVVFDLATTRQRSRRGHQQQTHISVATRQSTPVCAG